MAETSDNGVGEFKTVMELYRDALFCVSGTGEQFVLFRAASHARKEFVAASGSGSLGANQALALLTLLSQARLWGRSQDTRRWGQTLEDEVAFVSASEVEPQAVGGVLTQLAKRLRPFALPPRGDVTSAHVGGPAGRLGGVELCARLVRAHASSLAAAAAGVEVEWLSPLLECQLLFLESMVGDGERWLSKAGGAVRRMVLHWLPSSPTPLSNARLAVLTSLVDLVGNEAFTNATAVTGLAAAAKAAAEGKASAAAAKPTLFVGLSVVTLLVLDDQEGIGDGEDDEEETKSADPVKAKVRADAVADGRQVWQQARAQWRALLVKRYAQAVLEPSHDMPVPVRVRQAFAPLLGSLLPQEYREHLSALVEKLLKKCPEAAVAAVASLFSSLSASVVVSSSSSSSSSTATSVHADNSGLCLSTLVPPLLKLCRSTTNDKARDQALVALSALSERTADAAALVGAVQDCMLALEGKGDGGGVTQWSQRYALLCALRSLLMGARRLAVRRPDEEGKGKGEGGNGVAVVAAAALECLIKVVGKEPHAGTRTLALVSLGDWAALLLLCPTCSSSSSAGAGAAEAAVEALVTHLSSAVGEMGTASGRASLSAPLAALLACLTVEAKKEEVMGGGVGGGGSKGGCEPYKKALVPLLAQVVGAASKRPKSVSQPEAAVALHLLLLLLTATSAEGGGEKDATAALAAAMGGGGSGGAGLQSMESLLGSSSSFLFAPSLYSTSTFAAGQSVASLPFDAPSSLSSLAGGAVALLEGGGGGAAHNNIADEEDDEEDDEEEEGDFTAIAKECLRNCKSATEPWPHLLALCRAFSSRSPSTTTSLFVANLQEATTAAAATAAAASAESSAAAVAVKTGLRGACPPAAALARCMVHPAASVRQEALEASRAIVQKCPEASVSLVGALWDLLASEETKASKEFKDPEKRRANLETSDRANAAFSSDESTATTTAAAATGGNGGEGGTAAGSAGNKKNVNGAFGRSLPAPSHLRQALDACLAVPRTQAQLPATAITASPLASPDALPTAALLAHHPALCGSSQKLGQQLWRRVAAKGFGLVLPAFASAAAASDDTEGDSGGAAAAEAAMAERLLLGSSSSTSTTTLAQFLSVVMHEAAVKSELAAEREAGRRCLTSFFAADGGVGSGGGASTSSSDSKGNTAGGLLSSYVVEKECVPLLLKTLVAQRKQLEALTDKDLALLRCPDGVLLADATHSGGGEASSRSSSGPKTATAVAAVTASAAVTPAPTAAAAAASFAGKQGKSKGGDFGAEQEELAWEDQVRKELEAKKQKAKQEEEEALAAAAAAKAAAAKARATASSGKPVLSKKEKKEAEEMALLGLGGVAKKKKASSSGPKKASSSASSSSSSSSPSSAPSSTSTSTSGSSSTSSSSKAKAKAKAKGGGEDADDTDESLSPSSASSSMTPEQKALASEAQAKRKVQKLIGETNAALLALAALAEDAAAAAEFAGKALEGFLEENEEGDEDDEEESGGDDEDEDDFEGEKTNKKRLGQTLSNRKASAVAKAQRLLQASVAPVFALLQLQQSAAAVVAVLVGDCASQCLHALCGLLDERLEVSVTSRVAENAIRLAACVSGPQQQVLSVASSSLVCVSELVEELFFYTVQDEDAAPLDAASWQLVWPVIDTLALRAERPFCACADKALAVLTAHARATHLFSSQPTTKGASGARGAGVLPLLPEPSALPLRKSMMDTLLYVVNAPPTHPAAAAATKGGHGASDGAAAKALTDLLCSKQQQESGGEGTSSSSPPLSPAEWAPLLKESGLLGPTEAKLTCLKAMQAMAESEEGGSALGKNPLVESRLWLVCHDHDKDVQACAREVWGLRGRPVGAGFAAPLIALLGHPSLEVRQASADALAGGLGEHPTSSPLTLGRLQDLFLSNKDPTDDSHLSAKELLAKGVSVEEMMAAELPTGNDRGANGVGAGGHGGGARGISGGEGEGLMSAAEEALFAKRRLRSAVGMCFASCGRSQAMGVDDGTLELCLHFVIQHGLSDPDPESRGKMLEAGTAIVDGYGKEHAAALLELLEAAMDASAAASADALAAAANKPPPPPTAALSSGSSKKKSSAIDFTSSTVLAARAKAEAEAALEDKRREGTVVLLGTVAKHLAKDDPKALVIVHKLVDSLSIPSESVQRCVADCLAPLMASVRANPLAPQVLDQLLQQAIEGETYADRKGAAYGVAAAVKGLGIGVLKQRNVVSTLEAACSSTGSSSAPAKQGALSCFECLCARLKLLFEPYVVVILPLLLKCFSDGSSHVRDAAHSAARTIMANLSQHGVKLVLPKILDALGDDAWRTKQAAIQLLGAMAYCAPKQLGSCLPQIVPKLTEAFSDTHPKVRDSGKKALKDVRSVVRNPEISGLSEVLLAALTEPAKHTKPAIEALLVCEFIHSIDAPSLALLVPVLQRGMKERSADVKRKGALIAGNMSSMISDPKDMVPYLPALLPGLQDGVLDPIPDVRTTAAKALGQLVQGIGVEQLKEVLPWLITTLKTAPGTVERSGAAQGLSEVLAALGDDKCREVLDDLLPLASHPDPKVREGVMWTFNFLPVALSSGVAATGDFSQFLEHDSLPKVLSGLSDEMESVREVALKAGQVIISTHGRSHVDVILKALEDRLGDENWRIRYSSVQLLGDLLYLLGGTKACVLDEGEDEDAFEQDDGRGDANAASSVGKALGTHRRNSLLASLYVLRSDTSSSVRQCTLQVWKTMVPNTPRTLREILKVVIEQILNALSGSGSGGSGYGGQSSSDRQTVASRALGDVVKKLGERVLPEMVPILRQGLSPKNDASMRQGVCLGLAEVLANTTKHQVESYLEQLIQTVQDALCDEDAGVRDQAAIAFQMLHRMVGAEAVDAVVPSLLSQLQAKGGGGDGGDGDEDSLDEAARDKALFGLCQVLRLRSRELLPVVMAPLLKRPMPMAHIVAIGTIAQSASRDIHHVAPKLLPAIVAELCALDNKILNASTSISTSSTEGAGAAGAEGTEAEEEAAAAAKKSAVVIAAARKRRDALDQTAMQVVSSVSTSGVQFFGCELLKSVQGGADSTALTKKWGVRLLEHFFASNKSADYGELVPMFVKDLVKLFVEPDRGVLDAVRDCLNALTKSRPLDELLPHLDFTRNLIVSLVSETKHRKGSKEQFFDATDGSFLLPLFNVPKGIEPLLALYQHGLLNGSSSQREVSAQGLGDLVSWTGHAALKPFLIKMTGPLIRVVGDKFPSPVKAAILQTLRLLLDKGGAAQKPFVPQLQKSFVKALSDPSNAVREPAALALGQLMALTPRVDPLVADLQAQATCGGGGGSGGGEADAGSTTVSKEVQVAMLRALASVFASSGAKVGPQAKEGASGAVCDLVLGHPKEEVREAAAQCLAEIAQHLAEESSSSSSSSSAAGSGLVHAKLLPVLLPNNNSSSSSSSVIAMTTSSTNLGAEPWCARHGAACAIGFMASASCAKQLAKATATAAAAAAANSSTSGGSGDGGGGGGGGDQEQQQSHHHRLLPLLSDMAQALGSCLSKSDGENPLVATACCQALARTFKASTKMQKAAAGGGGGAASSSSSPLDALVSDAKILSALAKVCGPHSLGAADIRVQALHALKAVSKACPSSVRCHGNLSIVMTPLLDAVKDPNIRVKMAGERCLMHVLEVHTRQETLDEFVATSDMGTSRFVRDYAKRVLLRLAPESGDEDNNNSGSS